MKFDIAKRHKMWFAIASTIMLIAFAAILFRGFNLGIDFTGGTIIDLKFQKETTAGAVRDVLKNHGLENSIIQLAGTTHTETSTNVVIRTMVIEDEEARVALMKDLEKSIAAFEILRMEKVGATIGAELTRQAILAIVVSWFFMIIYITYRFEFNFAIAAIICLAQDVFVVLGFFALFQKEIDSSFVAALLTVVGYSINGTIVIFDRIRENMRTHRRTDSLEDLVNNSVWQTMTRSLYTVLTVLFATVSLLIFGGDTIRNFALAMTVGFISGTITSIILAGSLWLALRNRKLNKKSV